MKIAYIGQCRGSSWYSVGSAYRAEVRENSVNFYYRTGCHDFFGDTVFALLPNTAVPPQLLWMMPSLLRDRRARLSGGDPVFGD